MLDHSSCRVAAVAATVKVSYTLIPLTCITLIWAQLTTVKPPATAVTDPKSEPSPPGHSCFDLAYYLFLIPMHGCSLRWSSSL